VGFDDTKFRRPVVPGDQLRLEVRLVHRRGNLVRFWGRCGWARPARPRRACSCSGHPPVPGRGPPRSGGRRGRPRARCSRGALLRGRGRGAPRSGDGARLARGRGRAHERRGEEPLLPVQLDRPRSPGPEVPRRADPGRDRRPQRLPRGDDGAPRHGGGRGRHSHRVREPLHGAGARGARLPGGQPRDPRQRCGALRPRRGAGLRDPRRLLRGAPSSAAWARTPSWAAPRSPRGTWRPSRSPSGTGPASSASTSWGCAGGGFAPEAIAALRRAYRVLVRGARPLAEALLRLEAEGPHTDEVQAVVDFVRSSKRGVRAAAAARVRSGRTGRVGP
jgi:hypothetical protein